MQICTFSKNNVSCISTNLVLTHDEMYKKINEVSAMLTILFNISEVSADHHLTSSLSYYESCESRFIFVI